VALIETLRRYRDTISNRWFEAMLEAWPEASARFMRGEDDPFRNPVGTTLRRCATAVVDSLLGAAPTDAARTAIEEIVRIRAVQQASPASALGFVFHLRRVIAEVIAGDGIGPSEEWLALDAHIDDLALAAFAAYAGCRERIHEIRTRDALARTYSILRRAGAVEEAEEATAGGHHGRAAVTLKGGGEA
jgi:hypothetical protein